jgi:DNA repair exonuclease SbcCD ATPase subunit
MPYKLDEYSSQLSIWLDRNPRFIDNKKVLVVNFVDNTFNWDKKIISYPSYQKLIRSHLVKKQIKQCEKSMNKMQNKIEKLESQVNTDIMVEAEMDYVYSDVVVQTDIEYKEMEKRIDNLLSEIKNKDEEMNECYKKMRREYELYCIDQSFRKSKLVDKEQNTDVVVSTTPEIENKEQFLLENDHLSNVFNFLFPSNEEKLSNYDKILEDMQGLQSKYSQLISEKEKIDSRNQSNIKYMDKILDELLSKIKQEHPELATYVLNIRKREGRLKAIEYFIITCSMMITRKT